MQFAKVHASVKFFLWTHVDGWDQGQSVWSGPYNSSKKKNFYESRESKYLTNEFM